MQYNLRNALLVDNTSRLKILQKDMEDDLKHLTKDLKHANYFLVVTPAYCHKHDFTFIRTCSAMLHGYKQVHEWQLLDILSC